MSDSLSQTKRQALVLGGTLNPRADHVVHPLFEGEEDFFDPHDLIQVKYEALRCWRLRENSLSEIARQFGISRPTLYGAKAALENRGLEGLLPVKRGPKAAHKLTVEVVSYLEKLLDRRSRRKIWQCVSRKNSNCTFIRAASSAFSGTIHSRLQKKGSRYKHGSRTATNPSNPATRAL
ncbi:MAG: helix-turn-helix domain-containing protein [Verrucomicrobia bacterium]|nr:helix-turn-helix domain-containing protein [Verrucomicrobiota bacterium]